jgi:putative glutamine amidotransferase
LIGAHGRSALARAVRAVEARAAEFGHRARLGDRSADDADDVPGTPHLELHAGGAADGRRAARVHGTARRPMPAMPPLIAVTTSEMRTVALASVTAEADPPRQEMVLGMRYLEAISRAGALAVVVPPLPGPEILALLDRVDGICLSGGPDLHPDAYGAAPHTELGPTEPRLDAFELALARAADERDMPILAICRGAQVLNVARGGTLHQHLPDVAGDTIAHRQPGAPGRPTHAVDIAPESRLAGLVGGRRIDVNSFHHQAVDVLGDRLALTAWADDGTVEGFEAVDRSFVLGVQWHAECLVDLEEQASLFSAFVSACAEGSGLAATGAGRLAQAAAGPMG